MKYYRDIIVQLARLGDLIQVWPLIASLNSRHGAGNTALVVDERLAEMAELMVGSDNVVSLPINTLLYAGLNSKLKYQWKLAARTENELQKLRADRVINLNYHRASAAVAEAIPCANCIGARWIDVVSDESSDHQFAEIFFANTGSRSGVRHLSDIWRDYSGHEYIHNIDILPVVDADSELSNFSCMQLNDDVRESGRQILDNIGVYSDSSPIAVIPGAGMPERKWNIERWCEVIGELCHDYPVVLLGTNSDVALAEDIIDGLKLNDSLKPVASLCGKTNLTQLAGVLSESRLTVGVDTGALHLAAALGTACLGIYYGSMHFRETGPYGNGHVVITPDDMSYPCHEHEMSSGDYINLHSISGSAVIQTIRAMFEGRSCSPLGTVVYNSVLSTGGVSWRTEGESEIKSHHLKNISRSQTLMANAG